jgi:hypothetical protein
MAFSVPSPIADIVDEIHAVTLAHLEAARSGDIQLVREKQRELARLLRKQRETPWTFRARRLP